MTDNWVNMFFKLGWNGFERFFPLVWSKSPKLWGNLTVFWICAQIQEILQSQLIGLQKAHHRAGDLPYHQRLWTHLLCIPCCLCIILIVAITVVPVTGTPIPLISVQMDAVCIAASSPSSKACSWTHQADPWGSQGPRHTQQNSALQFWFRQTMWLQPPSFSMVTWHFGHSCSQDREHH